MAGRFPQVEIRRRYVGLLCGMLVGLSHENCWTMAEQAGDTSLECMYHLLSRAKWETDWVAAGLRDNVIEHVGEPNAVLMIDEIGRVKNVRRPSECRPVRRHHQADRECPGRGLPRLLGPGQAWIGWIASSTCPAAGTTTPGAASTIACPPCCLRLMFRTSRFSFMRSPQNPGRPPGHGHSAGEGGAAAADTSRDIPGPPLSTATAVDLRLG